MKIHDKLTFMFLVILSSVQYNTIFTMTDMPPIACNAQQLIEAIAAAHAKPSDITLLKKTNRNRLNAYYQGLVAAVCRFIDEGADVNGCDRWVDATALILAVCYKDLEIVKAIIAAPGFSPQAHDQVWRAYSIAMRNGNKDIVALLLPLLS